jgi:hypothetical protein
MPTSCTHSRGNPAKVDAAGSAPATTVAYVTQSTGNLEPHDGIDPHHNAETETVEQNQSNGLSRAADGGPPPTDAPESGSAPALSGTAAGQPLDGVTLDDDAAQQAVSGDTGPEHPGTRRSS